MKLKLFLAFSLLAGKAMACFYAYYYPSDTRLYRIMEDISLYDHDYNVNSREYLYANFDFQQENLKLWREQTGTKMSDERLSRIIYGNYSEADMEAFYDPDGADQYLRIAKNVQKIREAMVDPWYFPSGRGGGVYLESLEELVETCKKEAAGLFRGRYVLQGLRCLNNLRRWQESIDFWEQHCDSLTHDVIRIMSEREVAAAYHQMGQDDIAADIYARVGDIASLRVCRANRDDEMEYMYKHCPDSPYFPEEIQVKLTRIDDKLLGYESDSPRTKQFLALCLRVIRERKVKNLAIWYYAAAATLDAMDRPGESLSYIRNGSRLCNDVFLSKSFRILMMHVEARILPMNHNYDKRLFRDLRWLCREIDNNMNPADKRRLAQLHNYKWYEDTYYWNSVMRRILLSDVCPRLVAIGRTTRALQLANFADYYMFRKLDNSPYIFNYYLCDEKPWDTFSYSSGLFELTDSLSANQLATYVRWQTEGRGPFDQFLSSGSNHNATYWNDIVGTHYLRENKYEDAVSWLALLPKDYERQTNIYKENKNYLLRDPFDLSFDDPHPRRNHLKSTANYKLNFARRMLKYEKDMEHGKTADIRGEAKVYYAAGLRNQMDYCWALTKYSYSCYEYEKWDEKGDPYESEEYRKSKELSNQLVQEGLEEVESSEIKARLLHSMHRNREVMQDYPATETARQLRLHCDMWRDYVN